MLPAYFYRASRSCEAAALSEWGLVCETPQKQALDKELACAAHTLTKSKSTNNNTSTKEANVAEIGKPTNSGASGNGKPSASAAAGTEKIYLSKTWQFTLEGVMVVSWTPGEDGTHEVVLNKTIFHPQGGGQPADQGTISTADGSTVFNVHMVKEDRATGLVEHNGKFSVGSAESFQTASGSLNLKIDEDRRRTCARVHSAGHVLDVAMGLIGHPSLKPTKGYHFPDGAYVEYEMGPAKLTDAEKDAMPNLLSKKMAELIEASAASEVRYCTKSEALGLCPTSDLTMLSDSASVRMVKIAGGWCPCGGTHIETVAELGAVTVTKVKAKKSILKVSYEIGTR